MMPDTEEVQDLFLDTNEACYVYSGPKAGSGTTHRSKKRRRTAQTDENGSYGRTFQFPRLLNGREPLESAAERVRLYHSFWKAREASLTTVLEDANADTVARICDFINDTDPSESLDHINAGLVTASLATSSSGSVFEQVEQRIKADRESLIKKVSTSECHNLKAALKAIIRNVSTLEASEDEDDMVQSSGKGVRLLNYDLGTLHNYVVDRSITRAVLFFQNSEAIDGNVLTELIDVFSSWQDRIPFILLFESATSIELFQEKLSRSATRRLRGVTFETRSANEILDRLFLAATTPEEVKSIWLGSEPSMIILDRQTDHMQSARGFMSTYKFMYMNHFFRNPLSVLLSDQGMISLSKEQLATVRGLPSFKLHVQDLKDLQEGAKAHKLLRDDKYLQEATYDLLGKARESLEQLFQALEVLTLIHTASGKTGLTWSRLYVNAMSGELADSTLVRELCMAVRKMPSDVLSNLLDKLSSKNFLDIKKERSDLIALLESSKTDSTAPLRSEHDIHRETFRTTVVAQKVSLSKHKAALSKEDTEYSKIINRLDLTLKDFLSQSLIKPKDLCLSEVLIFDPPYRYKHLLSPAPRATIERALSNPHDYLKCDCCGKKGEESHLSPTQPTTAILYQLYLESGAVINIADLWSAFRTILSPEDEGKEGSEEQVMALFYRGLAELKYLGFIKGSKRKPGHLVKLRWKGL